MCACESPLDMFREPDVGVFAQQASSHNEMVLYIANRDGLAFRVSKIVSGKKSIFNEKPVIYPQSAMISRVIEIQDIHVYISHDDKEELEMPVEIKQVDHIGESIRVASQGLLEEEKDFAEYQAKNGLAFISGAGITADLQDLCIPHADNTGEAGQALQESQSFNFGEKVVSDDAEEDSAEHKSSDSVRQSSPSFNKDIQMAEGETVEKSKDFVFSPAKSVGSSITFPLNKPLAMTQMLGSPKSTHEYSTLSGLSMMTPQDSDEDPSHDDPNSPSTRRRLS